MPVLPFSTVRHTGLALISLLSLAVIAGCGGGSGSSSPPPDGDGQLVEQPGWSVNRPTRALSQKKWTVLVYMNAANDLEKFGSENMNQMEKIGSSSDVNIVLQYKRMHYPNSAYDDKSNGDWVNTRRYYVQKDDNASIITSPLISSQEDVDMGSPQTLQDFVQWGVKAFPAEKYCLILWNHGAGWRSRSAAKPDPIRRGISYDDAKGTHIDTIELPNAINIGRKWDILCYDASLMQMLEVAYEVRNKATYIVGSEESPPGAGYRYDRLMGNLVGSPGQDPLTFSRFIANDTLSSYGTSSDITQSVLDASRIEAVATAVNQLGSALTTAQGQWGSQIAAARRQSEYFGDNGEVNYTLYKDLGDFLNKLAPASGTPSVNDPGVISAAASVRSALNQAVLANAHGNNHPNANGLSIYIPSPVQYGIAEQQQQDGFGQPYSALSFSKASPAWTNFLQTGPP